MNGLFVITILILGLQIASADVDKRIYTNKQIEEECTWTFAQLFGSKLYLSPRCTEYWYCDYEYFVHRVLQLVKCTGKAKYFDPNANDGEGV